MTDPQDKMPTEQEIAEAVEALLDDCRGWVAQCVSLPGECEECDNLRAAFKVLSRCPRLVAVEDDEEVRIFRKAGVTEEEYAARLNAESEKT